MMFITGPLYSGKRTFARKFRGSVIADVQDAAAEVQTPEQLEALARELADGRSTGEAIVFANMASALAVSRVGAQDSIPSYEEVLDFKKRME